MFDVEAGLGFNVFVVGFEVTELLLMIYGEIISSFLEHVFAVALLALYLVELSEHWE